MADIKYRDTFYLDQYSKTFPMSDSEMNGPVEALPRKRKSLDLSKPENDGKRKFDWSDK